MVPGKAFAVKVVPTLGAGLLATIPVSPVWFLLIPLGLLAGTMVRAGRMVEEHKPWGDISRDFGVSLLIGGGNALLAALVIKVCNFGYLEGTAVAFGCAFLGVRAIEGGVRYLIAGVSDALSRIHKL